MSHRRLRLLVGLVVIPILWLGFSYTTAYNFVHPPRIQSSETPRTYGVRNAEAITFDSVEDRIPLHGWLLPAVGTPRGALILCHGRGGNQVAVFPLAAHLSRNGFTVLTFNFRASGDSGGDTSSIGWHEVRDAEGAVAYLKARPETKGLPLGIYGASMGASVAIQAIAADPTIRAAVADSSYARLDRAVDQRFRGLIGASGAVFSIPVQFFGERLLSMDAHKVAPVEVIARIAPRPLLLIHGTGDILIRSEDSEMLYQAAGQPKELWLLPGVPHTGAYRANPKEYCRRVTAFFTQALAPEKPRR